MITFCDTTSNHDRVYLGFLLDQSTIIIRLRYVSQYSSIMLTTSTLFSNPSEPVCAWRPELIS